MTCDLFRLDRTAFVQQLECVRLGNLDLDFKIQISFFFFFFAIERKIRKRISTLRYFLGFPFYRSIGPKKDLKTVLKNSRLARARIIRKKKTAIHENSFVFRISQSNGKNEISEMWIWIS